MPGPSVPIASDLYRECRREFVGAYEATYKGLEAKLGQIVQLATPSTKLTEYYGYFQSAPMPARWPRGENIPEKGFKSKAFSATNYRFGRRVKWDEDDREDEQLGGLMPGVRATGARFALLPEMFFYEVVNASASLLDAIPNAPDGVDMFNATDGDSAARYGVTGGNIITGSGYTTTEHIITDIMAAMVRFASFQDTEGQPLYDLGEVVRNGFVISYNVAYERLFGEALKQLMTIKAITTQQWQYAPAAAAVSNLIQNYGLNIDPWPTQRLSGVDWIVALKNPPAPLSVEQVRRPLRERTALGGDNNSDSVRDRGEEYIQWDARLGWAVGPCYSIILVDNT